MNRRQKKKLNSKVKIKNALAFEPDKKYLITIHCSKLLPSAGIQNLTGGLRDWFSSRNIDVAITVLDPCTYIDVEEVKN